MAKETGVLFMNTLRYNSKLFINPIVIVINQILTLFFFDKDIALETVLWITS